MSDQWSFPASVVTVWRATVVLALVVLVPAAVYWLHTLWRSARSIRNYARESLAAAREIQAHTAAIPALAQTIEVAGGILSAADAVTQKLSTIAGVLEARSAGGR